MEGDSWFDGHLDLACLALEGRDLRADLPSAAGPPQPAGVTLPSLLQGRVTHALATLFTGLGTEGACGYSDPHDIETPNAAARAQLGVYAALVESGDLRLIETGAELAPASGVPLSAVLLMEGADPIRDPGEAGWWFEAGVRVVGLTWARGTRYAGGNAAPGPLTASGRELVAALDELGIIHDLSHLADAAAFELLRRSDGPVVASHSNCRSLCVGHSERNLPDDLIRAIADRDGLIGINLFSLFLAREGGARRATVEETVEHIEHIAALTGRTDVIALGSDMDGGFGADRLPAGINRPADLPMLLEELRGRGWSEPALTGFRFENWQRFLERSLPRS